MPSNLLSKLDNITNGRLIMFPSQTITYTGVYAVEGCIIDKEYTLNQTKKTCTHELGHALGWIGHSGTSSDIMYQSGSSITSLTYRDIQHLSQVY